MELETNSSDSFNAENNNTRKKPDIKTKPASKPATQRTLPPQLQNIPIHLLQKREIFLDEVVAKSSVKSAIMQLYALSKISKDPITLNINSPGGSINDGLALYDTMRELMNEGIIIKTKAYGCAASMGSFLLSAGTPGYRSMLPNAKDMTHQPARGFVGAIKEDDLQHHTKSIAQTRRRMEAHYADFMGLDYKDEKARNLIKQYMSPDVYLNAYTAKRLGLIDSIIMVSNDNKPDGSLSQEFLKRSIQIDMDMNEMEYNEIDTSEYSTDPARHVKKLIDYREQYLANQVLQKTRQGQSKNQSNQQSDHTPEP